jgi:hypothetical protein
VINVSLKLPEGESRKLLYIYFKKSKQKEREKKNEKNTFYRYVVSSCSNTNTSSK